MTTNGKTLLVYESMSFIKAIQWCKDHLIMIKNHQDISKLIQGIIGTITVPPKTVQVFWTFWLFCMYLVNHSTYGHVYGLVRKPFIAAF